MIARMKNDICFSTAKNGMNPFNFDGRERTELTVEEAATAFDFDILKRPSYDSEGRRVPGHYHLQRSNDGKGGIDVDALASGFAAGRGVNLARPCEGRGGSPLAIGGGNPLRLAM